MTATAGVAWRLGRAGKGPRVPSAGAGFTLVELLIALALIALILLLLFSGLRLGSRAWEGVEGLAERGAERRVARQFLTAALLQARDAAVEFDGEPRPVFAGDAQHLEWAAPLATRVGLPGLYLLRLSVMEVDGRAALVLVRWLLHPDILAGTDEVPPWAPLGAEGGDLALGDLLDQDRAAGAFGATVLLPAVEGFEIAYFGLRLEDGETAWGEDWIEEPMLPQRLSIRIETAAGAWPELLVDLPTGR
ncbi:prepilin-type N-terminal cleavage/methylation domain-containing protein [Thiococcus pfennigii]|uniref:prepilin-type N-terminal cleavage/methylation domain-containing protein n=1 Tax=Thiococcus pfennigii TaxID=1057 RepID=UPI0030B8A6A4